MKHIAEKSIVRQTAKKEPRIKGIGKSLPAIKVGSKYGVSDNAIRKWANRYGLDWNDIKRIRKLGILK